MFRCDGILLAVLCLFLVNLHAADGWTISNDRNLFQREAVDDYYDDAHNDVIINSWESRNVQQHSEDYVNKDELREKLQELPKNDELFEGDMVMDNRLRNAVLGISKKSVITLDGIKWPDNTLIYEEDPNFLQKGKELLREAIKQFETRTCIRFKKRTNESNYVFYTSAKDICSSNIGMIGGKQKIHIGADCMVLGTVLHETMHALGFIHEHSRPDRDDYVTVNWNNIKKDEWSNFNKYSFADVNNEGVKYNFASVMHYRNDAFTKNGRKTLVANGEDDLEFGQRIKFSIGDVEGINHFYNCLNEMQQPNYRGLFKDYSGREDTKKMKRVQNLRQFFREKFFDYKRKEK